MKQIGFYMAICSLFYTVITISIIIGRIYIRFTRVIGNICEILGDSCVSSANVLQMYEINIYFI
jgi:hypothetical protein